MGKSMNINNTQICTTMEQSKRLLELGLKPETADMLHYKSASMKIWGVLATPYTEEMKRSEKYYFPAWSLHRLMTLIPKHPVICSVKYCFEMDSYEDINYIPDKGGAILIASTKDFKECNLYEKCINCIQWLIEFDSFNKEYLKI